jgi:hypothetical protein
MRMRANRIRRLVWLGFTLTLFCGLGAGAARGAAAPMRTVVYHGYTVTVPRSWPVYDLARDPAVCVRFDRHALYLGLPGDEERCPAQAAGRSEAILLEPAGAFAARAATAPPRLEGAATSFKAGGVRVVATWSRQRALIARALHRRSLPSIGARPLNARGARIARSGARAAGAVYTGLGFDACSAPSSKTMAAWGSSPYRALGVYIGGVNSACSQPNLNSSWVSSQVAAGWHLIPTYVGLQAPTNSCGCAAIYPSQASAQGAAAADDAVIQAQGLGLGAGNPIYDDMEGYPRGGTNSSAVLAFLSGWTSELHAKGYLSGVYSSSGSGVSDLAAAYGTGYLEPDDIWIANWNGQQTTSDSSVPSSDWQNHERLHQYRGGHNETYGGATINIDSNYLDGATADTGAGSAQAPPPVLPPSLTVSSAASGITNLTASWSGQGLSAWRVLAGTAPSALNTLVSSPARGAQTKLSVRSAAPYYAVQALGSAGQVLANSSTLPAPPHLLVFGRSSFVNQATGVGGVPVGCYVPSSCHVVTTISLGRITLVRTGSEAVPAGGTGIVFFKLTSQARRLLTHAPGARLPVQVITREAGGSTASASLVLIPFATSGPGPRRSLTSSPVIGAVGVTDFVFARGSGGILAACSAVYACPISAALTVGRTTIAVTRPEAIGGNELGYLFFSLTAQGRTLLTHAPGNQLGASLLLRSGTSVARARIALVQFG